MLLKYAIIENQYYAERHRGGCMTLVMFITIVTSILSAYFAYKMHKKGFDSSQCLIYSILLLICICALFLIISKSFYLKTYIVESQNLIFLLPVNLCYILHFDYVTHAKPPPGCNIRNLIVNIITIIH